MKSIVLGTISLNRMAGGLEKNIVLLANHFAQEGINTSLITFDTSDAQSFYEIDPGVTWHKTGNTPPHTPVTFCQRLGLIGRIRAILRTLDNPVVICFHHGILFRFLLAALGFGLRFVCSERNSLSLYQHIQKTRKWSVNFMLLSLVDRVTVQFPSYIKTYPSWIRNRICVIPNPVSPAQNQAAPETPDTNGRFKILAVGRLSHQKNHLELIQTFAGLYKKFDAWDLYIIGDGEKQDALQEIIDRYALNHRVFLMGKRSDINKWLAASHIFCMPSKWEGFPNALAEAMAHGLPSVGFLSCDGVRDLIQQGKTGLLASEGKLTVSLETLMTSPALRKTMGENAVQEIAKYHPSVSFGKWHDLLRTLNFRV